MNDQTIPIQWNGQRDHEFRQSLYDGIVFRLPGSEASTHLVDFCRHRIVETFGDDFQEEASTLNGDDFFQKAGALRRDFYESTECRQSIAKMLASVGCEPADHQCDPVRLRVIRPGGHHIPAAAPVYFGHRDTWYSNPQTQITWWLPLHDVEPHRTFEFLLACFDKPVPNDSEGFDYDRWTSGGSELKVGWQDRNAGNRELYPRLTEDLHDETRKGFSLKRGECLVFSGQHLHQTVPIESGPTRFSIDFRTVHQPDHVRGLGPTNVDNRSTGDALQGHVPVVTESTI